MPEKSLLTELLPWAAIIGTLGGSLITGIIAFSINLVNKKSEERRNLQEILFKSAVEEWKQHSMFAIELMKMKTGKKIATEPLVTYLVHLMKLSEVLLDGKTSKENISQKLAEVSEIMKEVKKFTAIPKKEADQNPTQQDANHDAM